MVLVQTKLYDTDTFMNSLSFRDQAPHYQGPLLTVYQWQQPLASGDTVTFERCIRPDTVAVLAFSSPTSLFLVREQQLGRMDAFTDAPGGRVDPGEEPEDAARRELREEIGYEAGRLFLWDTQTYGGLITFNSFIYLAADLVPSTNITTHDATEHIEIIETPLEEAYRLSLTNGLRRSEVMLTLLRLQHDPVAQARLHVFLAGT